MPHVFFHLCDGDDLVLDDEGRIIDDHAAVVKAALHEARGMISAEAMQGRVWLDQRIDVVDAAGTIVHRLQFADAVFLKLPAGWQPVSAHG